MNQLIAAGTIASDIVRKETRNGVVATFRLCSGAVGHGQVWIDVEAWGNLAGTIHQHGTPGRTVIVGGRLTQKSWQDRKTGEARHRYVVAAADIDLLPECHRETKDNEVNNTVIAAGTVAATPTVREAGSGAVTEFRISSGRAGSKSGRLWIDVEHWHREPFAITMKDRVVIGARLAYGRSTPADSSRYYLDGRTVVASAPTGGRA